MTKAGRGRRHSHGRPHPPPKVSDLGPYVGFLIAWVFVGFLFFLTVPDYWRVLTMAVAAGFALYVTLCTGYAYLGRKLMNWQRGLVRLPLILVGAGRKPVSEVKGTNTARLATFVALLIAIVLIFLTWWVAQ